MEIEKQYNFYLLFINFKAVIGAGFLSDLVFDVFILRLVRDSSFTYQFCYQI